MKTLTQISVFIACFCILSCASQEKEFDQKSVTTIDEFDKVVKIEALEPVAEVPVKSQTAVTAMEGNSNKSVKKTTTVNVVKKDAKTTTQPVAEPSTDGKLEENSNATVIVKEDPAQLSNQVIHPSQEVRTEHVDQNREPKIEDNVNFKGRRPLTEPFRVGEELVMGVSYFAVEAGKFTMQVKPMVQLNGKKSYHFRYLMQSSPLFSMFYRVDDVAETFVDYETLLPHSYEIHVNESKQLRETKTYFDHKKLKATMWDQKQKKNEPIEKRKIIWDLKEYSQNVFSAAYYLRNFKLEVGKKLKVHVGHEGKNILMTAEVLRKEKIFTPVGAFETFVVKPEFDIDGKFKPTGENFLWLTADDRKFIVRLESKIKIGSIRGEVQKLNKEGSLP